MFNKTGNHNQSGGASLADTELKKARGYDVEKIRHDFRSSLNVIIGYSELMLDGVMGTMTEEQLVSIKDILNKSRHLAEMVNGLTGR